MLRRLTVLLLAMLLLSATAVAQTYTMAGFDGEDSGNIWESNEFFIRMEEDTGVSFTFSEYTTREAWNAAKAAMFAQGGTMPDVLFKASLTEEEQYALSESGQLIDLLPLLPEYAPDLWALLQEHPDWLSAITLPNGKIAALPLITEQPTQNAMWINREWLDSLGLDAPTDWDSLRRVLTAFRDGDPNGNGKKDEIPLAFLGPWDLKFLSHGYGVAANDYNIYLDDAGQVHYWVDEDSFIELARTLHSFWEDGLLDPSGFVTADSLRRITDSSADITFGMFFAPTPINLVPYEAADQYEVLSPLMWEGSRIYRDLIGEVRGGAFAITSACDNPQELVRWINLLYTEDGAITAMVGREGKDYRFNADGTWSYTEALSEVSTGSLSVYDTGTMPWLFPLDFYRSYSEKGIGRISTELDKLNDVAVKPFPHSFLPEEIREKNLALQNQLGPYVDTVFAQMILGDTEINDATVAAFRQGLRDRGMEDMTALWQSVADSQR